MANLSSSEPSTDAVMPAGGRVIAHLDMDAFYASVELLDRPDLVDKPVIVGGRGEPNSRGVVTTCNYKAREFGVRSGMPMRKAAELCPAAVYLPVNFDRYRHYSRLFKAAIAGICDRIEDRGIDEVYIDLTAISNGNFEEAQTIAIQIKQAVFDATQLTCSVGLAPNKLIAKIASDLDKPNGLSLVKHEDIETMLWPLPVKKVNGIGPKACDKLALINIWSIGELAATPVQVLIERFGSNYGRWLNNAAWGRDQREIEIYSDPKSVSKETTFERDLHPRADWHALAEIVADLCEQLAAHLSRRTLLTRTIGVKLRYDNFASLTRDVALREPCNDLISIRKAAFECLAKANPHRKIRLVGVKASGLEFDRVHGRGSLHLRAAENEIDDEAQAAQVKLF
jgi:DNA polymerase IV